MSAARDRILGRIRAIHAGADELARRAAVEARLREHRANLVPARARRPHSELIELLADMLKQQGTDVTRLERAGDVPGAVARYLREHNLPARLRMGSDAMLADLPWETAPALERLTGKAEGDDAVALSRAWAGAAETGTLFLVSGADNPTTLNFLPDTHVAVLRVSDVVGSYEEGWDRIRAVYGEGALPRTVNLISGPSRTADIEQTIIMGAHGPRRLHVILVEE